MELPEWIAPSMHPVMKLLSDMHQDNTANKQRQRMIASIRAQQELAQKSADYQKMQQLAEAQMQARSRYRNRRSTEGIALKHQYSTGIMKLVLPRTTPKPETQWEKDIFKMIDRIIKLHSLTHGKPKSIIFGQFELKRFRRFMDGPHFEPVECFVPKSLPYNLEDEYLMETLKPLHEQEMDKFSEYRWEDGIQTKVSPKTIKRDIPYYSFNKLAVVKSSEFHMIDVSSRRWYDETKRQQL